jgi:outer membrane biosynthesis protein TonB
MQTRRITFVVVAIHVCIALVAITSTAFSDKKKQAKLVVHTVKPKQTIAHQVAPAPPPPVAPKPVVPKKVEPPKEVPKKETAKPVKAAKPAPAKKPAAKAKKAEPKIKEEPVISDTLLQELQESIAKIDQKRDKIVNGKKLDTPKSPKFDSGSRDVEVKDESFHESLIAHLHEALNLPEYGEVKIQLTLNPDGSVAKVAVLKSESEKNRGYLEKSLPHLQFPPLRGSQQTFTLTFCNEI